MMTCYLILFIVILITVMISCCKGNGTGNPFNDIFGNRMPSRQGLLGRPDSLEVQVNERREIIQNMTKMARLFDLNKFSEHTECPICLMSFTDVDMVTPLPCDKRHYFHSKCIEEWSLNHHDCPVCRIEFDS